MTEHFPIWELETVCTKGRIAQLQSGRRYFTCLRDECQNVWGMPPTISDDRELLKSAFGQRGGGWLRENA